MQPASRRAGLVFCLLAIGLPSAPAVAQTPAAAAVRLRGTLISADGGAAKMTTREGETVSLAIPADVSVQGVRTISLADIKPGSFIGMAAMPQPDGGARAAARVLVGLDGITPPM